MKNFAIFINPAYPDLSSIFDLLNKLREEYHITFYATPQQRDIIPEPIKICDPDDKNLPRIDCILVFGGDGSILRAKDLALKTKAPILGINLGYLGFLSETSLTEIKASIENLIGKKYRLLSRMLLNCHLRRGGAIIYTGLALNDVVVYKAETPRLIHVRIFNHGRFVFDTRCDGVIASTPTGSTAYSLSAGGPILSPEMQAIVLCPLNPHLLSMRPMVFPARDQIMLRVHGLCQPAWLQIDGVNTIPIEENDEVMISAAKQSVSFIKLSNRTFYQILRKKLHLGK
ncbi:MAG: NAD(+)/NADH kinase [Candidatus Cloacimonadaceae bacterium]|nr:NAD(+)/NADH kinase [Candidatus Cloacimonadaceae bacterium]MDP3114484.1 NAD(+)/NADH kinase [Candidatus Cloacimonadaceae bacterium]